MSNHNLQIKRNKYGFEVDLSNYKCQDGCEIYTAFLDDREHIPLILKLGKDGMSKTHYMKLGSSWNSESLSGNSHELAKGSPEYEALDMLTEAHNNI